MSPLVDVETHLGRILDTARGVVAAQPERTLERVPLGEARGRVLAADVEALAPVPPFTNSSMDGFAVRAADLADLPDDDLSLPVDGDVAAGAVGAPLAPGTAQRIMTGAPIPEGADAVVPVEATDHSPGPGPAPARVRLYERPVAGVYLRHRGEDVAVGDQVLTAGTLLGPAQVAAAASVGHSSLTVARRPRVLVVTTGDELVAPGEIPGEGHIPDSNSLLLAGLVAEAGGTTVHGRSRDDVDAFLATLDASLPEVDLVVTAGGVSAGAHEVVRQSLETRGIDFLGVAMQPGKPQGFGTVADSTGRRVPVVALPGNPVSVFVTFHVLVRPLLAVLTGADPDRRTFEVVAGRDWPTPPGRRQYAPVVLSRGEDGEILAEPPHPQGAKSHFAATLALADALAIVPAEVDGVRTGDRLEAFGVRGWGA
ncbi:gephyrin-like molybdotransferase Glp [Georgenia sp. Z1344]|uniref:molybdopterin molybdotransferase MoeA n=1 Tax=Georgenia sp. Z1344 TaxID=3416706 RepID=UPI003CFA8426